MTRKSNATRTFPIVLKSIIADTHKSNPSFTLNDKQIRARLRANENVRKFHAPNTSHVANNASQYDAIRCAYDAVYAASLTKPARVRKPRAKTNAAETTDA